VYLWVLEANAVAQCFYERLGALGLIRERQKSIDDAIRCLEKVIDASPGDASAHYHLGLCYEHQGLDGLAITELSKALELDPSDTAAAAALQELQR
jgi:tetratricopeptide (TPR) repeat protein